MRGRCAQNRQSTTGDNHAEMLEPKAFVEARGGEAGAGAGAGVGVGDARELEGDAIRGDCPDPSTPEPRSFVHAISRAQDSEHLSTHIGLEELSSCGAPCFPFERFITFPSSRIPSKDSPPGHRKCQQLDGQTTNLS